MVYIILVIYNRFISDIDLLRKIGINGFRFVLVDNSDNDDIIKQNSSTLFDSKIKYICNHNNVGLSKAYNIGIDWITNNSTDLNNIWIMFADDDTNFSDFYLNNVLHTCCENKNTYYHIVSGIIKDQFGTIISPVRAIPIFRMRQVETLGMKKNIICINSGLVVKWEVFTKVRFDEGLFLDLIDYKLFYDLKNKQLDQVMIVDGEIIQGFSGTEKNVHKKTLIKRFDIYKKDLRYYYKNSDLSYFKYLVIIIKRMISVLLKCI